MNTPGSDVYLRRQRSDLLRFAAGSACRDGFGWLRDDGSLDAERPVELWITCRMTHVFALGALAGEEPASGGPNHGALADLARHGVEALSGPFRDPQYGGWFASVDADGPHDSTKQVYGHAFVILAASSAAAAGLEGGTELLADALALTESRFWDDELGLAVEEWDRSWSQLDDYRGLNGNLHLVEAYLAAGDVTGDRHWHEAAGRVAEHVRDWTRNNSWRVPNHFDSQWRPDLEHNRDLPAHPFRPFGAMVGDGMEWARLLVAVDGSLGASAPTGLTEAAVALYDRAVSDAWLADGADGFVYTTDWEGVPVVHSRMHWVVLEAINAAVALHQVTGEERFVRDAARWWQYADRCLVDHDLGSWHHELDAQNRVAGTVWKGKPDAYHAYQAALLPTLPVVPSFARAIADRTVGRAGEPM